MSRRFIVLICVAVIFIVFAIALVKLTGLVDSVRDTSN